MLSLGRFVVMFRWKEHTEGLQPEGRKRQFQKKRVYDISRIRTAKAIPTPRKLCDRTATEHNFSVFDLWRKRHGGEIVAARRS